MKVFEQGSKVNFVDDNNVFVGYDIMQDCCEDAGYLFSPMKPSGQSVYTADLDARPPNGLASYSFDTDFMKRGLVSEVDEGDSVTFRLTSSQKAPMFPEIFLTLYNQHNGYYGHGFQFGVGEEVKEEGML